MGDHTVIDVLYPSLNDSTGIVNESSFLLGKNPDGSYPLLNVWFFLNFFYYYFYQYFVTLLPLTTDRKSVV